MKSVVRVVLVASILAFGAMILTPYPAAASGLFVTNTSSGMVNAFKLRSRGDSAPTATINLHNPQGEVVEPDCIAIDLTGKIYVTSQFGGSAGTGSIEIYSGGGSGDDTPIATIAGDATGLDGAYGIAVDASGNIYVTNAKASSVTVYAPGSAGNAKPVSTIAGPKTHLQVPYGITVDPRGAIYVANSEGGPAQTGSITVFDPGSRGNVRPTAIIAGDRTKLDAPWAVARDSAGNLCVANLSGNSVTIFAAGSSGNVRPSAAISGAATGLNHPQGIAVDAAGRIYVANFGGSSVTVYAAGSDGDIVPSATLAGISTGLSQPTGIAIAP
ncbi:MAG TPA: NHL repeat-containing protein [Candidatus Binataceae bacterium]|nr:NHL repeat-containing protein [Candidatus Binataceae bacterium]